MQIIYLFSFSYSNPLTHCCILLQRQLCAYAHNKKQLLRIEKLENGSGGGSKLQTSLDVLKEIGMKDDILRKQQELESGCFGWFMDEEVVKSRLKVVKSSTKTAFNNGMKRKDKSGSMNGSGSGAGKFTSVSGTKKNYHNVASTNRNYNSNPFDVLG